MSDRELKQALNELLCQATTPKPMADMVVDLFRGAGWSERVPPGMSDRELVAPIVREIFGCGAMLNGPRPGSEFVYCDDPRLPDDVRSTCDCRVGADKILAALSAAGRLRAEVTGEVVEACKAAFEPAPMGGIKIRAHEFSRTAIGLHEGAVDQLLERWIPIIAADAERRTFDRAIAACRKEQQDFLSPQYAIPQPVGSISERFACGQCIEAIEKLRDTLSPAAQPAKGES